MKVEDVEMTKPAMPRRLVWRRGIIMDVEEYLVYRKPSGKFLAFDGFLTKVICVTSTIGFLVASIKYGVQKNAFGCLGSLITTLLIVSFWSSFYRQPTLSKKEVEALRQK